VAGRVDWTRTSRQRRIMHADVALLDRLSADHSNRATLEAHNGQLLDLLIVVHEPVWGWPRYPQGPDWPPTRLMAAGSRWPGQPPMVPRNREASSSSPSTPALRVNSGHPHAQ